MDAASVKPERHPLRLAGIVAAAIVAVLAGAALIVFLWLRTYAPLGAVGPGTPGTGLSADVEPVTGSGGKPVFVPAYTPGRSFDTAFTLHNTGHFAVTVLGLGAPNEAGPQPAALLATDSSANTEHARPFERLRLNPDDTAAVVVRWRLVCAKGDGETYSDVVPLRYRYLSMFTRTERIRLPFAVTLRCSA